MEICFYSAVNDLNLFAYMKRELEDKDETERWKIDEEGDEDENWPKPPDE